MDYWFGDGFDWMQAGGGPALTLRWSTQSGGFGDVVGPSDNTAFGTGKSIGFSRWGVEIRKLRLRKEPIINGSFRMAGNGGVSVTHQLLNNGVPQLSFVVGPDMLSIYTGKNDATGVLIGQLANPFPPNSHHSIQYRVLCDSQNGQVHLWKNGSVNNLMPPLLNVNTRGGSLEAAFDGLSYFSVDGVLDDVLHCSPGASGPNGKIGDIRVFTQKPNAQGASTQFIPSNVTAQNWQQVVNPDGDGTYVETDVVGNTDLYRVTPLPSTPSRVYFAIPWAMVKKTDAGPLRAALVHQSGGVQQNAAINDALGGSYDLMEAVLPQDPATSTSWNRAGLEAQQVGMKKDA
jgi:hypothetical protein